VGRKTDDRKPKPKGPRSKPNRPRPKIPIEILGRKNFRPKFIRLIRALQANRPNTRIPELIEEYGNGKGKEKATKKGKEKEKASQQATTCKSSMYVTHVLLHYLTMNTSCII
jgi:hypothetical protein